MRPSSYRISIEKRVFTDEKQYSAPYEPIAPLSEVLMSSRGTRGQYGLGKGGQEWYCVQCFEKLLAIYYQRVHRIHPKMTATTVHPVLEVAYYILAEERETVGCSGKLMLCSTKQQGLELWKARCLAALRAADPFYIPMNTPGRADFLMYFPSPDGKAVYLSRDARDYRGRLDDGTVAEIPGDEVDGCTLTELMNKLNMRHFTQPSVPEGQTALERQAKYTAHPYDDPSEEDNEPSHPSRINPRVPVLRISQAADDRPSRVASDGHAASQTSQAIDDQPSRVASDGLATPQTSQAADDKPTRVASDATASPETINPTTSMPNAKDPKAQPLVVLVASRKSSNPEKDYAQEAKKASKTAESSAASLKKEETVGEATKRKDVLTAAKHSSTAPTRDTEAVAPSTSGASTSETASVVAAGKRHEKLAKDS